MTKPLATRKHVDTLRKHIDTLRLLAMHIADWGSLLINNLQLNLLKDDHSSNKLKLFLLVLQVIFTLH